MECRKVGIAESNAPQNANHHLMKRRISVIICTHQPNPNLFPRVLRALGSQTISPDHWELLVVSSGAIPMEILSTVAPVETRHVVEGRRGITRARIRSYRETNSEVLVLVDDDTVVAPDYLQRCLEIADGHPHLGVWGGRNIPVFAREPEPWMKQFWPYLALRDFERDIWCNWPDMGKSPFGAGMCVRRVVVDAYLNRIKTDPLRADLSGGEDNDLAFVACDIGLGMGLFTSLFLKHHIPENRTTESYLLKRFEDAQRACVWLEFLRDPALQPPSRATLGQRLIEWYHLRRLSPRERRFRLAARRGRVMGYADLAQLRLGKLPQD